MPFCKPRRARAGAGAAAPASSVLHAASPAWHTSTQSTKLGGPPAGGVPNFTRRAPSEFSRKISFACPMPCSYCASPAVQGRQSCSSRCGPATSPTFTRNAGSTVEVSVTSVELEPDSSARNRCLASAASHLLSLNCWCCVIREQFCPAAQSCVRQSPSEMCTTCTTRA